MHCVELGMTRTLGVESVGPDGLQSAAFAAAAAHPPPPRGVGGAVSRQQRAVQRHAAAPPAAETVRADQGTSYTHVTGPSKFVQKLTAV